MTTERDALKLVLCDIENNWAAVRISTIDVIKQALAQPEPELFVMDWPAYHSQAQGCGLEDRGITDRYEAMAYGWDQALERVAECLPDSLYTLNMK